MATIALYAGKINQMPVILKETKNSVADFKSELLGLKNKSLKVNMSVCNLDDVVSAISASVQTQEQKTESLELFQKSSEQFISDAARVDSNVAVIVNQRKDDFYSNYNYLKPSCEKNVWENFLDGCEKVGEWCKEHWKALVTVAIVIVAVALICTGVGGILGAMALGALIGTGIGGTVGGIVSVISGGSFFEGFENGAFSGAIAGIISGGMGFAMSSGGTAALNLGQILMIGGVSGSGTSLVSDIGDILIKGDDISFAEVLFNMTISGLMGMVFAGIGYGISKGISALKVKLNSKVTPLENGPYIKNGKPNGRPDPTGKAKLKFEQEVYDACVDSDGILRDPNTKEILDWKPGQPRKGKVDFGHKAGKNYSKMFKKYKYGKISLEELKAFQSNPKNFRIEHYSSNRSHEFEKTLLEIMKEYPWLSSASDYWKELNYAN